MWHQRLAKLKDEPTKRVVDGGDRSESFCKCIAESKTRGFWNFILESVLDNVLPAQAISMQYRFKDSEIIDAVIFWTRPRSTIAGGQ